MKDPAFIQQVFTRSREAADRAREEFASLSATQLNWKPAAESWSIGQCLDHLIISDSLYFPSFKKMAAGNYKMSFWQNWNPFSGLFARMLISQVAEKVKKKLKAPRVFIPSAETVDPTVHDRFQKHLDTLSGYIRECRNIDLDKTHITSPVSKFVTYSLRSALLILVQHEHRHINQAMRLKGLKDFPAN